MPFFRVEAFCVPPVFLLAAQRAFINRESLLRPAGVSCPFRFEGAAPPVARFFAQRAVAAAASFALVAGEKYRPVVLGAASLPVVVGAASL